MLSLILLPFSSYQNKSCYFNFVRRTLACPWGRPTERLKFARRSKILSRCEITSALAMWLDWQILSVIAPYQNRLVASADRPLQTLELFSAHARLYNAAASPASRLRLAGSLAKKYLTTKKVTCTNMTLCLATLDISIFWHGSAAFGSKMNFF